MTTHGRHPTRPTGVGVDVCVVGAGPHGLAVVTHLVAAQPSLRDRIAVLDPSGSWLTTWRSQFERLEIGVLRSPVVHHTEVDPGALAQYTVDERLPRSHLPYDPPLTEVFDRFSKKAISDRGLDDLPSATRVRAIDAGDGTTTPTRLVTDQGDLFARYVVWAGNTCRPVVPDAFPTAGPGPVATHSSRIDLRGVGSLDGEHVLVVGGGLTAGHLVLGACSRGATVTLVTRRPIVERNFDVEPGWLGPLQLDAYERDTDLRRRLDTARAARGGGSMPAWMCDRIRAKIDRGSVEHVVGEVCDVHRGATDLAVTIGGRVVRVDHCWLATGTTPDVRADAALSDVVDDHVDGVPVVDTDLRVGGTALFVTGRLATIRLGPAAGNLWGARVAARRISAAITGVNLDTDAVATIAPPVPLPRRSGEPT